MGGDYMKIQIITQKSSEQLHNYFLDNDLKSNLKNNKINIIINNKQDVDIFISGLSRFIFTHSLHNFKCQQYVNEKVKKELEKDFFPLLFIRMRLLIFLQNNNNLINIDDFITFNLKDIDDIFYETASQISVRQISDEIGKIAPMKYTNIKNLKISFTFAFNQNSFHYFVFNDDNFVIAEFSDKNFNTFQQFLHSVKFKKVTFSGIYNEETIELVYKEIIRYSWLTKFIDRTVKK